MLASLISLPFGLGIAGISAVARFVANPLLARTFDVPSDIKSAEHIFTLLLAWGIYSFVALIIHELIEMRRMALQRAEQLEDTFLGTVIALSKALDARDHYTAEHSRKVAEYSRSIAETMGLRASEQKAIYLAGLLHDVGKIGIPGAYLHKPGKLSDEEWAEIRKHPLLGYEILQDIPGLGDIARMILHHHERFDGRGYPHRIDDGDIPLGARILCVADSFDAMTSERIYRPAIPKEAAIVELKRCSGTQFDPQVVETFCHYLERLTSKAVFCSNKVAEPLAAGSLGR
ncbi:MAG: HD-GYP domain-containing protein [Firmicutes bacterium]|nr:HD-GYP domain-containing protein [Bacillota bacterium]